MNKDINSEKIKRVKIRKILKTFIIIFGLLTIILAILSLLLELSPIFAILSFMVEAGLSYYRNKLDPKLLTTDSKNQE